MHFFIQILPIEILVLSNFVIVLNWVLHKYILLVCWLSMYSFGCS